MTGTVCVDHISRKGRKQCHSVTIHFVGMRFVVSAAGKVKMLFFWVYTLCNIGGTNQCSGGTHCLFVFRGKVSRTVSRKLYIK
jgi:hypothetical protein